MTSVGLGLKAMVIDRNRSKLEEVLKAIATGNRVEILPQELDPVPSRGNPVKSKGKGKARVRNRMLPFYGHTHTDDEDLSNKVFKSWGKSDDEVFNQTLHRSIMEIADFVASRALFDGDMFLFEGWSFSWGGDKQVRINLASDSGQGLGFQFWSNLLRCSKSGTDLKDELLMAMASTNKNATLSSLFWVVCHAPSVTDALLSAMVNTGDASASTTCYDDDISAAQAMAYPPVKDEYPPVMTYPPVKDEYPPAPLPLNAPAPRWIPARENAAAAPAPFDQHARHPAAPFDPVAPFDQHARHPAAPFDLFDAFDQHATAPFVPAAPYTFAQHEICHHHDTTAWKDFAMAAEIVRLGTTIISVDAENSPSTDARMLSFWMENKVEGSRYSRLWKLCSLIRDLSDAQDFATMFSFLNLISGVINGGVVETSFSFGTAIESMMIKAQSGSAGEAFIARLRRFGSKKEMAAVSNPKNEVVKGLISLKNEAPHFVKKILSDALHLKSSHEPITLAIMVFGTDDVDADFTEPMRCAHDWMCNLWNGQNQKKNLIKMMETFPEHRIQNELRDFSFARVLKDVLLVPCTHAATVDVAKLFTSVMIAKTSQITVQALKDTIDRHFEKVQKEKEEKERTADEERQREAEDERQRKVEEERKAEEEERTRKAEEELRAKELCEESSHTAGKSGMDAGGADDENKNPEEQPLEDEDERQLRLARDVDGHEQQSDGVSDASYEIPPAAEMQRDCKTPNDEEAPIIVEADLKFALAEICSSGQAQSEASPRNEADDGCRTEAMLDADGVDDPLDADDIDVDDAPDDDDDDDFDAFGATPSSLDMNDSTMLHADLARTVILRGFSTPVPIFEMRAILDTLLQAVKTAAPAALPSGSPPLWDSFWPAGPDASPSPDAVRWTGLSANPIESVLFDFSCSPPVQRSHTCSVLFRTAQTAETVGAFLAADAKNRKMLVSDVAVCGEAELPTVTTCLESKWVLHFAQDGTKGKRGTVNCKGKTVEERGAHVALRDIVRRGVAAETLGEFWGRIFEGKDFMRDRSQTFFVEQRGAEYRISYSLRPFKIKYPISRSS